MCDAHLPILACPMPHRAWSGLGLSWARSVLDWGWFGLGMVWSPAVVVRQSLELSASEPSRRLVLAAGRSSLPQRMHKFGASPNCCTPNCCPAARPAPRCCRPRECSTGGPEMAARADRIAPASPLGRAVERTGLIWKTGSRSPKPSEVARSCLRYECRTLGGTIPQVPADYAGTEPAYVPRVPAKVPRHGARAYAGE